MAPDPRGEGAPPVVVRVPLLSVDEATATHTTGFLPDDVQRLLLRASGEALQGGAASGAAPYDLLQGGAAPPEAAGAVPAGLAPERSLLLRSRDRHQVTGHPQAPALRGLVAAALAQQSPQTRHVRANPTLRRDTTHYRLYAPHARTGVKVVRMRMTATTEAVLARCGDGSVRRTDLVAHLVGRADRTSTRAVDEFVTRLETTGLLLPAPSPAGDDTLLPLPERAVAWLRAAEADDEATALENLNKTLAVPRELARYAEDGFGPDTATGPAPSAAAEAPAGRHFRPRVAPSFAAATVDHATVDQLRLASAALAAWSGVPSSPARLREAVREHFADALVPLAELADPDRRLLEPASAPDPVGYVQERHTHMVRALARWMDTGEPVDLAELAAHRGDAPALPPDPSPGRWIHAALLDEAGSTGRALFLAGWRDLPENTAEDFGVLEFTHWVPAPPPERIVVSFRTDGTPLLTDADTGAPVTFGAALSVARLENSPLTFALERLRPSESLGWDWGALGELPHLPRVKHGAVMVAPEQWSVRPDALAAVVRAPDPAAALRACLPGVGDRRWLGLRVPGRTLPVDSAAADHCRRALRLVRRDAPLRVVELPQFEHPAVVGESGRHTAEVLIDAREPRKPVAHPALLRHRGSPEQVMAYRFVCAPAASDRLLVEVAGVLDRLRAAGQAEEWYVQRSGSAEHRLTVLCHTAEPGHRAPVLAALGELVFRLTADGWILDGRVERRAAVSRGGDEPWDAAARLASADTADVLRYLSGPRTDMERLERCVADCAAWARLASRSPTEKAALAASLAEGDAPAERLRAVLHAFERARPAARADAPYELDAAVAERLTDLARTLDSGPPATRRTALTDVLRAHCGRLFPDGAPLWRAATAELTVRSLQEGLAP
ncbi:hypothetical protein Slala03_79050 [Streptomyces lavendulae subsp. lavendulae]|nr:hypothetical protein Slala03_79050 [Streptomyces lavendulae subsp. lavendulae]